MLSSSKKENDTKKNCLKTVSGFKMSFFEEHIEFNFRFSLKPDFCLGSLAQMYAPLLFRVSLYKNLMNFTCLIQWRHQHGFDGFGQTHQFLGMGSSNPSIFEEEDLKIQ